MPTTAGKKRSMATKKMDFLDSDDSDEPAPPKKAPAAKAAPVPAYVEPVKVVEPLPVPVAEP
jgi:hypothetical protein